MQVRFRRTEIGCVAVQVNTIPCKEHDILELGIVDNAPQRISAVLETSVIRKMKLAHANYRRARGKAKKDQRTIPLARNITKSIRNCCCVAIAPQNDRRGAAPAENACVCRGAPVSGGAGAFIDDDMT